MSSIFFQWAGILTIGLCCAVFFGWLAKLAGIAVRNACVEWSEFVGFVVWKRRARKTEPRHMFMLREIVEAWDEWNCPANRDRLDSAIEAARREMKP